MTTTEHPVRQLLWCALNALKTAQENHNITSESKRLARTVLIFTERSDQLSRATDRVPGLPASPGYAQ